VTSSGFSPFGVAVVVAFDSPTKPRPAAVGGRLSPSSFRAARFGVPSSLYQKTICTARASVVCWLATCLPRKKIELYDFFE
jgi:hypothetical protein